MKSKANVVAVLVLVVGVLGSAGPLMATPDESQRLRGLEGRVFEVWVHNLTTGDEFQNCYLFLEDGVWVDPGFPVPGTWVQHTNGASTTYTAEAFFEIPGVLSVLLVQEGAVTPAQGSGVLQLEAFSRATGFLPGPVEIDWEFVSVGFQNDDCTVPSDG